MATFDVTNSVGASGGYPAHGAPRMFTVTKALDFSSASIVALNSGTGPAQNDVLQLIHVPAKTVVHGVYYTIDTASSNLADFDIGDGADIDGYHDGVNLTNGTNDFTGFGVSGTEAFAAGKYYASADTIDGVCKTAASIVTGKITITVIMTSIDGVV